MVAGLGLAVGGQRPDADRGLRCRVPFARLVQRAIQRQRLLDALAIHEEVGEGVGQPEVRREPGAVIGAAEDPERGHAIEAARVRRRPGVRHDAAVLASRGPGLEVADLFRELVGRAVRLGVERERGAHVAARRAAHAEVDAPGRQRVEHAELFGHLQRRVVRQHHARAADADAAGARGHGGHQHFGRGAHDGRQAVVLAQPEPLVAQGLAVHGEIDGVADRGVLAGPGECDGLVEDREFHGLEAAGAASGTNFIVGNRSVSGRSGPVRH